MAENKIEDALEKAGEILDNKLSETSNNETTNNGGIYSSESTDADKLVESEKQAPSINCFSNLNIVTNVMTSLVEVTANGYVGTKVRVRGYVSNVPVIELEDLDVDKNGYFWLTPTAGIELTEKNNFEFKTQFLPDALKHTVEFKFDVIRVEDSIVLCELTEKHEIEPKQVSIIVNPDSNCIGAKLEIYQNSKETDDTIGVADVNFEFSKAYYFDLNSEVTVTVEKEGFKKYIQTVILTEDNIIDVELEPATFKVEIRNSFKADSVDCHVIIDSGEDNHVITENSELVLESGSKVIVTAKKKGYKDYKYTIDSLKENTVININSMERVSYTLKINNLSGGVVFVNGTETNHFPLEFTEGTEINITVAKNHYVTYNKKFQISEDTVLDITLEKEQHILTVVTVPTNAIVTISSNGVMQQSREIQLPYGSEAKIKVEHIGYETIEKTIFIDKDITECITLNPLQLTLTIDAHNKSLLDDVTIFLNDVKQDSNVCNVIYDETNIVTVCKPGYPDFEQELTLTEDTILYLDDNDWRKPQVSISILNKQDITNPITITINNQPVSDNSPIDVNYDSEVEIIVDCDGYEQIKETKLVTEDYNANYELIDINSNKVKLDVVCNLKGAKVTLNGISSNLIYVEPGNEVTIVITHDGYETLTELVTITEDTTKTYNLDNFTPKDCIIKFKTKPTNALISVNNILVNNKKITTKYLDMLNIVVSGTGYETKEFNYEVLKDDTISVELELNSNFDSDNDEEITLEKIIEMIKFRKNYSYLDISRVFVIEGYTEAAVDKFYRKFGSYCVSRYDFKLWDMMHKYFGHKQIPHPQPDK